MTVDFEDDTTFYTSTMARVLAGQGRYDAAARIYRHLLERSPGRPDLEAALAEVREKMSQAAADWGTVSDLLGQWVRLMLRRQALRRLRRLRWPTPP